MSARRFYLIPVRAEWQTLDREAIDVTDRALNRLIPDILAEVAHEGLVSIEGEWRLLVLYEGAFERLSAPVRLRKEITTVWVAE